jgi:ribosomal protein L18E
MYIKIVILLKHISDFDPNIITRRINLYKINDVIDKGEIVVCGLVKETDNTMSILKMII